MHVVVVCADNGLGQVVLETLHANHIRSWLIHTYTARSLRYSRFTTPVMMVDGPLATQATVISDLINTLHRQHGIDMVLASDVQGALLLCDIHHTLVPRIFPSADRPGLELLDDKWRFGLLCQQLDIPIPKTLCFDTTEINVNTVEHEIGFPVVMKPTNMTGSNGVVHVRDRQHMAAVVANYPHPRVVIQEYVQGTDIGLSLFACGGQVSCATTFHCGAKTRTEFVDIPQFVHYCRRIVDATKYSGVANFDARIDQHGQIKLFECNPRFFVRLNYVRLAGIDFLRMGLPGMTSGTRAVGTIFSRTDIRGIVRMFTDRLTASIILRSWYEYLSDPGPRLMTRLMKVTR